MSVPLDFSRAFDTVSQEKSCFHVFLVTNIRGDLLKRIMQFFSNRTHQTKVGMALSEIANLTSSVKMQSPPLVLRRVLLEMLATTDQYHQVLFGKEVRQNCC